MGSKIHINLQHGLLEVEGSEEFVERIYYNFTDSLPQLSPKSEIDTAVDLPTSQNEKSVETKPKKRQTKRSTTSSTSNKTSYKPKIDPELRIDKKKLEDFVGQFVLRGHAQNIVVFAKYLEQEHDIAPCTADQIYTCYKLLKLREPARYQQCFIDARGKNSFIEYTDLEHIEVSSIGENFFNYDVKRAE